MIRLLVSMALALLLGACSSGKTADNGQDASSDPVDGATQLDTGLDSGAGDTLVGDLPPGTGTTINRITSGEVPEGSEVLLDEVIVSAVDSYGKYTGNVYVQQESGGPGSGLLLYRPSRTDGQSITELVPGDRIRVQGTVRYYAPTEGFSNKAHIKELSPCNVTLLGSGSPPAPSVVTPQELTEEPGAETWEGVLVQVADVLVTKGVDPSYGDFWVDGILNVDDELYAHEPGVGQCLTITGVAAYFYLYKLYPRQGGDIVPGSGCTPIKQVTIFDLQDETRPDHPAVGERVTVSGVVTAVDSTLGGSNNRYYGFWLQDPAGGPHSGIYIYYYWDDSSPASAKPQPGQLMELTGTYNEYPQSAAGSNSELKSVSWVDKGQASVPQPAPVAAADVATGGSQAEAYEGVLVQVSNLTVGDVVTDSTGKQLGFADQASGLLVENELYDFMSPTPPSLGSSFSSVVGPLHFSFDNHKILPRIAADLIP